MLDTAANDPSVTIVYRDAGELAVSVPLLDV